MDVYVWSRGLQPGQDAKSDGGSPIKAGEAPGLQAGPGSRAGKSTVPGIKINKIFNHELAEAI